ncbi:phosphoglycerate dehydrogenase [Solitalea sp. MAHUQ-68]|uniref:Phosphoglycerate dehydrogenase n=1 Tax=Solitalea agri TaxID=2953739 RepID=A0A9X2JDR4_9SPHI|nr:NAD(P)-dependent oxidoreductase [Solitalea agri]MCO4294757.1 phosphoglycerate dehydrogenase [Solitalea agri]
MHILIVDETHSVLMERLTEKGFICDYQPQITYPQVLGCIHLYDGMVVRTKFRVEKELFDKASKLKFIGRAGAGMDNIDVEYAEKKGVQLFNAPEGNANAVGEHTLGMLLAVMNKFPKGNMEVRESIWDREGNRGWELDGLTVGIIGYGFMGPAFAKKLRGFDVKVLAYDKYKTLFGTEWVTESSLDEIFEQVDVLSLHIPLTDETRFMVNEAFFKKFKKDIWFVNTARGEIVDIQGLLRVLDSGKVKGAGLDVLQKEKFPLGESDKVWFDDLTTRENVLLTPHVGGWSVESYRKISDVLVEKILEHYQ